MAQSMYVYKQSHIKISINACVFGILTYYYIISRSNSKKDKIESKCSNVPLFTKNNRTTVNNCNINKIII